MRLGNPVLCAFLAPLVLAGCGMPVGVQVASFLADGVSLLTTEKTITDHGLSAATGDDCAVWRGVQGDDICVDDGAEPAFQLAAAGMAADFAAEAGDAAVVEVPAPPRARAHARAHARARAWAKAPAAPAVDPRILAAAGPEWAPATVETAQPAAPAPVTVAVAEADAPPMLEAPAPVTVLRADAIPSPPAQQNQPQVSRNQETRRAATPMTRASAEAPAVKKTPTVTRVPADAVDRGGVFYVIGSYRRLDYAERFAASQRGLDLVILSGSLKGRAIYRVAIGPVAVAELDAVHGRLRVAGHGKAWALTLKAPKMAPEVAELR